MNQKEHLNILWTGGDPVTAEKMVFMYAGNSMAFGGWENIKLVVWGGSTKLVSENRAIQQRIKDALDSGTYITAFRSCSDQLGVAEMYSTWVLL